MVVSALYIYKKYHYMIPVRRLSLYCLTYAPLLPISYLVLHALGNNLTMLAVQAGIVLLYATAAELFILKNKVVLLLLQSLSRLLHLRK
jgi:hypothetical protein